ncbi:MAG: BNR repeat-containing protein [Planctomycetota bacterium]
MGDRPTPVVRPGLRCLRIIVVALAATAGGAVAANIEPLGVAPVWSAHPVGFALLTSGDHQVVGFYDADRRLTVAVRSLDERSWTLVPLPKQTGWDSHNYVALAVDRDGFVHLCADMHVAPLVYFRSRHPLGEPFEPDSFEPLHRMTGDREDRVTYPTFLHDAAGDLVFMYRDGSSGNGEQILDRYDGATRTWRRLLDAPLTSGTIDDESMNAYLHGPVKGPDGVFHLAWVWRDTPDCETCHDVCYARSPDLVRWERSDGTPLDLPITPRTCEVVDPVPVGGGLLNGLLAIGFDTAGRPVLSYHKYDDQGRSQVYAARRENGGWRIRQTSAEPGRLEFSGRGSLPLRAWIGPVRTAGDGTLEQNYLLPSGAGPWRIDAETLAAVGSTPDRHPIPTALDRVESAWPGMQVNWQFDAGSTGDPARRFLLRWETLGGNRDQPRPEPLPPPTMLRVIEIAD